MQANERDAGSLWDIAQATRRIQEFTSELSYEAYLESVLVQSAVERQFEIIGEASRRLSEDFRVTHSEIDWGRMIGLRNILAHQYDLVRGRFFGISLSRRCRSYWYRSSFCCLRYPMRNENS